MLYWQIFFQKSCVEVHHITSKHIFLPNVIQNLAYKNNASLFTEHDDKWLLLVQLKLFLFLLH